MKLFNFLRRKKKESGLNDEARKKSIEVRQKKSELRLAQLDLELQKVKNKSDNVEENKDIQMYMENPEKAFLGLFIKKFVGSQQQLGLVQPQQQQLDQPYDLEQQQPLAFTEDQIKAMISNLPAHQLAALKVLSEDKIKEMLSSRIPNVDPKSLDLAANLIKSS